MISRGAGVWWISVLSLCSLNVGCGFETLIFPVVLEPTLFPEPPAELGPFAFSETRMTVADLGDGGPGGVTLFAPVGVAGARPALVWVLGVNNRAFFHQSLHEYLASWGYVVVVPDTRDISFTDLNYHGRNTANARRVFGLAADGLLDAEIDADRIAVGGYSVGGTMAAFVAGQEPRARAVVLWAPSDAPFWLGVDALPLLADVRQPTFFLLGSLDNIAPVNGWPLTMQRTMRESEQTIDIIENGIHLFFQQPEVVDERNPITPLLRVEQMRLALERTRAWLDAALESAAAEAEPRAAR